MFDLDHGRMHNQPGLDDYKGSTLPVDSRSPNHQTTVLGSSSRSADIMSITSWSAAGPTLVCWTLESYRQLGRPAIWCIESYKQLYMNDQALRWVDWENDELDCEIHKLEPPDSLLKLPVFIPWQAESCYVLPSLAQPRERIQAATWANLWASSNPRTVTLGDIFCFHIITLTFFSTRFHRFHRFHRFQQVPSCLGYILSFLILSLTLFSTRFQRFQRFHRFQWFQQVLVIFFPFLSLV